MKSQATKISYALFLMGILTACGGGGSDAVEAVKKVNYSGRVIDESGTSLSGIEITLENRTTDKFVKVKSRADGSFDTDVEAGVYDILFNDPDAEKYITLQNTAIDLLENHKEEIKIQSTVQKSTGDITGSIVYLNGAPFANRKILIIPLAAHYPIQSNGTDDPGVDNTTFAPPLPHAGLVQTDALGNFVFTFKKEELAADIDFDLLVLRAGAPDFDFTPFRNSYVFSSPEEEFAYDAALTTYLLRYTEERIDIEKPRGLMHLNLHLGSRVKNLTNSLGLPNVTPEEKIQQAGLARSSGVGIAYISDVVQKTKNASINAFLSIFPSAHAWMVTEPFKQILTTDSKNNIVVGFYEGRLTTKPGQNIFNSESLRNDTPEINRLSTQDNTKYSRSIQRLINQEIEILPSQSGDENDYSLKILKPGADECRFTFKSSNQTNYESQILPKRAHVINPLGLSSATLLLTTKLNLKSQEDYMYKFSCSFEKSRSS